MSEGTQPPQDRAIGQLDSYSREKGTPSWWRLKDARQLTAFWGDAHPSEHATSIFRTVMVFLPGCKHIITPPGRRRAWDVCLRALWLQHTVRDFQHLLACQVPEKTLYPTKSHDLLPLHKSSDSSDEECEKTLRMHMPLLLVTRAQSPFIWRIYLNNLT